MCIVLAGVFKEVSIVFAGIYVRHPVQDWLSLIEGVVLPWHCHM